MNKQYNILFDKNITEDIKHKKSKTYTLDEYIKFLNIANKFVNHQPKRFKKISGDDFIL